MPFTMIFSGDMITVAGLLTGQDVIKQLTNRPLGERLLLPECMFRSGEEVFLDDVTRLEVQNTLQVPVNIVKSGGRDLVYAVLGIRKPKEDGEDAACYGGYEPESI